MTPTLLAQHQARQARLARFAAAAAKLNEPKVVEPAPVTPSLTAVEQPDPLPVRREYSTRTSAAVSAPLGWRIKKAVAREFGLTIDELISPKRKSENCTPRYVAIGLMLDMTRMSLPAIGLQLGRRDHTTVINGRNRISELLRSEAFRNRYEQMKAEIGG